MLRNRIVAVATAASLVAGTGSALASQTGTWSLGLPSDGAGLPGLSQLADLADTEAVTAIVTLDAVPTDAVTDALGDLGLVVQPMRQLPLAIVRGPAGAVEAAVATGIAADAYPEQRIELLDTASSDAMGAAIPRAAGLTGAGVTVAVVDSGCDGTHPDLADHITHNVKLVSAEYANINPDSTNTIVVPMEQTPYSNTDLGSGHGTHVAGIIAADGTTSPEHLGVAPDAELVCLAIGEVLFTTAVVTAYDFLLDQPGMWDVDVVNNSWGNSYAQFDPRNPVAVATRAIADRGVDVVFAAGNAGEGNGEATLNPFSQAPWVLSVAATEVDHVRGSFSSNGMLVDNSEPFAIGTDGEVGRTTSQPGHTVFLGERIGLVHPDVAAPGVDISSTCDSTGTVVGPCPPGENTSASGTSMASPHVAGAVAVLLQANPSLTSTQVRWALQSTARPVGAVDDDGEPVEGAVAPFWQAGYGRVDLAAAVDAVRDPAKLRNLERAQRARNAEVLAATGYRVLRSDFFTWDAPRATVGTDVRSFEVPLDRQASDLKVTIAYPTDTLIGLSEELMQYTVRVADAAGTVVVETTEVAGLGSGSALVQLPAGVSGPLTVTVTGDRAVSDPDTLDSDAILNDTVTVQVAQLRTR
jgi:serine protease AprX